MNDLSENFNLKQYMQDVVQSQVDKFNNLIRWGENEKNEFQSLLNELEKPFDKTLETIKDKGDKLERVVEFIIKKSYFYDVYKNVHTETNEIDEVIVLSQKGKQAFTSFGLSRELLPIELDMFLGECKNYKKGLGVTYVGKFYSLLVATDITFGIIFTQEGLSGKPEEYKDANGLTKILRLIEKYEHGRELYIITFTKEDYHLLLEGYTFFDLIKAKKIELQMASSYHNFLQENIHDGIDEIKTIIKKRIN